MSPGNRAIDDVIAAFEKLRREQEQAIKDGRPFLVSVELEYDTTWAPPCDVPTVQ